MEADVDHEWFAGGASDPIFTVMYFLRVHIALPVHTSTVLYCSAVRRVLPQTVDVGKEWCHPLQ